MQLQSAVCSGILRVNILEGDNLVINANMLQLQQAVWKNIFRVNMKEWDILVINVNTLQLQQAYWNILRVNMKEGDTRSLNILHILSNFPPYPVFSDNFLTVYSTVQYSTVQYSTVNETISEAVMTNEINLKLK